MMSADMHLVAVHDLWVVQISIVSCAMTVGSVVEFQARTCLRRDGPSAVDKVTWRSDRTLAQ